MREETDGRYLYCMGTGFMGNLAYRLAKVQGIQTAGVTDGQGNKA